MALTPFRFAFFKNRENRHEHDYRLREKVLFFGVSFSTWNYADDAMRA